MKRFGLMVVGFCLLGLFSVGCSKEYRVSHSWSDSEAVVRIEGWKGDLKVLHLSDSHITCSNESDIPFQQYSKRMDDAYKVNKHYKSGKAVTSLENFQEAMQLARKEKVDLIVLTGDIVNNPSMTSVTAVADELDKVGIPYLYVAGNHDWHYEGMEGTADELREEWREKELRRLYGGKSASHYAAVKNGVNFIAIDNSTYQVNEQQLKFFEKQIARGLPSVLLMHIPISLTTFATMQCGNPDWGSEVDKGYKIERRQRWPKEGNLKSTMEFVKAVASADNLVAVLCGHTHAARADKVNPLAYPEISSAGAMQYVVRAGAVGGYRVVYFEGD
ncbi:MAG: metallophosphoesterase [Sedimentisphaerales bacterium]|nr:metallophosphoesterase [Sedimentisphaerales bacterium]